MHIYYALIDALSAHMIYINLKTAFSTHVKHSPTKTVYIKYYLEKGNARTHARTYARTHAHTHPLKNLNIYDTDLVCASASARTHTHTHVFTHARTHIMTAAETGY